MIFRHGAYQTGLVRHVRLAQVGFGDTAFAWRVRLGEPVKRKLTQSRSEPRLLEPGTGLMMRGLPPPYTFFVLVRERRVSIARKDLRHAVMRRAARAGALLDGPQRWRHPQQGASASVGDSG